MPSVLGVLLICYSSRGHQLVFSYPPDPKRGHQSRRVRRGGAHGSQSRSAARTLLKGPSPDRLDAFDPPRASGSGSAQQSDAERFLGFETHFLSDVLSPKVALCDRQFQLTVDDVTFVGHPTLLHADRPGTGHRFARMIQRKRLAAQDAAGADHPTSTAASAGASGPAALGGGLAGDHDHPQKPEDSNSSASSAGASDISRRSQANLASSDTTADGNTPGISAGGAGTGAASSSSASAHQLSMFNLVFAMQPEHGQREVDDMYVHIISKLTAALKYEQLKRGYIRRETELILSIKDDAQCRSVERVQFVDVLPRVLAESTLARCLADTFMAVTDPAGGGGAHVVVNASVDLSLRVPDRLTIPMPLSAAASALGFDPLGAATGVNAKEYPVLRPYHALLLLCDPEEVLKVLPLDPLPLLVELIQIVTPTQSFEQLQTTLDCSLSHLYRLAAHLVHWRKAKIIDVVSTRNVYIVAPDAPFDNLASLSADFSTRFPTVNLPSVLADLAVPRPFAVAVPHKEARTLYLEILTYLLRHDLVTQLHMYIYLMIPYSICKSTPPTRSDAALLTDDPAVIGDANDAIAGAPDAGEPPTATFVPDPGAGASEMEKAWIRRVACEQPAAVAGLFLRLVPYFNGRCHVEEIVFRENLTRKDVRTILSRFREVVVTALLP
ncbi:Nitrogen permease regulator 3 [Geranomyces variabilis]|uniref:Nitrogen permease regulator 3 n=1 Tax=Geranomyces variabilis TaxID=109894 RepID=A0AAD5TFH6_9FUNG|nr:Nitrogen permease regulator 3 [Geranomyces variabilis]